MKINELTEPKLKVGDKIEVFVKGSHGGHIIRFGEVLGITEKDGKVSVKYQYDNFDFHASQKEGGKVSRGLKTGKPQLSRAQTKDITLV